MRHNIICLSILLFFGLLTVNGQDNIHRQLVLKCWTTPDSIMLRWAPTNFDAWQKANKYGYKVEKLLLSKNGVIPKGNEMSMLHLGVIKPLCESEWQSIVQKDSVWAPIALQSLWGETFELTSTFKKNIIQSYNKAQENDTRFGFALFCADRSISVAKALGLYTGDRNYSKQDKYIYRVYVNAPTREEGLDTAYVVVDPNLISEAYKPMKPTVTLVGKSNLLTWTCTNHDYVGYYVERSFDGKMFKQISKDLIVPFKQRNEMLGFYSDSVVRGKTDYYYRIIGLTPFGFYGETSDTAKVRTNVGIAPPIGVKSIITRQGYVLLSWNYSGSISDLSGFRIERSNTAVGGFLPLIDKLSPSSRKWEDVSPLPNGYYKVIALSKDGAMGESLETFVSIADDSPPMAPTELRGTVDSLGFIYLKWAPNKESDLMGYKIYRGNSANEEFMQINGAILNKTYFVDTVNLRTLTSKVYYKLVAVDKRYNSSEFSAIYELRRPDIIPPAPPILKKIEHTMSGMKVSWIPSPSHDVKEVRLYRSNSLRDSILVATSSGNQCFLLDSTRVNQKSDLCHYWCAAVDSAGNQSVFSNTIIAKSINKIERRSILLVCKVLLVEDRPVVRLEWNPITAGQKILLYKKENNGRLILYKKIEGDVSYYMDKNVVQGFAYEYLITIDGYASKAIRVTL